MHGQNDSGILSIVNISRCFEETEKNTIAAEVFSGRCLTKSSEIETNSGLVQSELYPR